MEVSVFQGKMMGFGVDGKDEFKGQFLWYDVDFISWDQVGSKFFFLWLVKFYCYQSCRFYIVIFVGNGYF